MARLSSLPVIARGEAAVRALPPYPAMALFLLPVAVIFPFKLAALWLMSQGHFLLGLACLLGAKLTGMAILARLYELCRPALISLSWFHRLESLIFSWRDWAHAKLDAIPGWRAVRQYLRAQYQRIRAFFASNPGFVSRRIAAAKRFSRSLWRKSTCE